RRAGPSAPLDELSSVVWTPLASAAHVTARPRRLATSSHILETSVTGCHGSQAPLRPLCGAGLLTSGRRRAVRLGAGRSAAGGALATAAGSPRGCRRGVAGSTVCVLPRAIVPPCT